MQELDVTVLGPTGVGKTSLLAAMYSQFERQMLDTELDLTPDLQSSAELQEKLGQLRRIEDVFEATPDDGVEGTNEPQSFTFFVGKRGAKSSLQLRFHDYPGRYHLPGHATAENREMVRQRVRGCAATVLAVDAPALMERHGRWNDVINRPQQMADLVKLAYQDLGQPRLLIIAPVKCERYLDKPDTSRLLLKRVLESYEVLVQTLKSDPYNRQTAVVVTPVKTVGAAVFSRVDERDGQPHFMFRKRNHDAAYSPEDTDQPLRYLLRFLVGLHVEERSWPPPLDRLQDVFKVNKHLKDAATLFAKDCKRSVPFAVLQDPNLLAG